MLPSDDALLEVVDAWFDALCARPAGQYIEAEHVLAALDALARPGRIEQLLTRYLVPARARLIARAKASAIPLGAWLPEGARDSIAAELRKPMTIPRKAVEEAIASEHVRDATRTMLQEAITGILRKATAAPGSAGVRGVLGMGMRAASAAGRGIFGGLGDELARQLEDRVREFIDSGVAMVQAQVVQRTTSPEAARMLGQRREKAFLSLLRRTEADAGRQAERTAWAKLDALVPDIVRHNLARAELRQAIRDELAGALADLGERTIGELLDDAGLRDALREAVRRHGLPLLRDVVGTPAFLRLQVAPTAAVG